MTKSTEHLEALLSFTKEKSFLSKEFLTWLWYSIEETGGEFTIDAGEETTVVDMWIDDKMTLESNESNVLKQSLKGGSPSTSIEATTALNLGKFVSELRIGANANDREYSFTLGAKDLTPRAIKLQASSEKTEHDEDHLEFRIQEIKFVLRVVDSLFTQFLNTRTQSSWQNVELENIKDWIQHRGQGEVTFH